MPPESTTTSPTAVNQTPVGVTTPSPTVPATKPPLPIKIIVLSICAVAVTGAALYFTLHKKKNEVVATETTVTEQKTEAPAPTPATTTPEPSKDASNDAIVDYLVDGLAKDDSTAAESSINNTRPSSQATTSVNTNF